MIVKNTSYDCSVCDVEPEGCPGCGTSAFEAGTEAGIRKVVEWITNQSEIMEFINMHREDDWQTQLEKWGVE